MNAIETAHYINMGACNPKGIALALHELLREDGRDFDAIRADPCYRVIVGQLAYLFGVSPGADIADMQAVDALLHAGRTKPKKAREGGV